MSPDPYSGSYDPSRAGDLKGAAEQFSKARSLHPALTFGPEMDANFDPATEAKQLRASVLVAKGRNFAANGDLDESREQFQEAVALDSNLRFDSGEMARSLVAEGLVKKGETQVRAGHVKEAIADYGEAKEIDPQVGIDAFSLNTLCWYGAQWGNPSQVMQVMPACIPAVQLSPDDSNIGDSLGVALVLADHDNFGEAIPLFQKFILKTTNKDDATIRSTWLAPLSKGRNPITPKEKEWLLVN
jgi:tetratricopeptide (TPR) repeat protein